MNGNTELFEGMLGLDAMAALALFASWLLVGFFASRIPFKRTPKRTRAWAWLSLFFVAVATVAASAKLFMLWRLSTYGGEFVADKIFVVAPMTLMTTAAALVFSVPRLWRLVRRKGGRAGGMMDASALCRAASEPFLVVPIHAAVFGAAISVYLTFFPPGVHSWSLDATSWTSFLAGVALVYARHRRMDEAPVRVPFRRRALRSGVVMLAMLVGLAGLLAYSSWSSELPDRFSMMSHESGVDFGGGPEVGHGEGESGSGMEAVAHGESRGAGKGAGHGGMDAAHAHEGHDHHSVSEGSVSEGSVSEGSVSEGSVSEGSVSEGSVSVVDLRGPTDEGPDERFTLTAEESEVELSSDETIEAWTFDGKSPGPEIRVREGDLVEAVLENKDIEDGVTLHWHGVDVPNAEDGVAGLTQNAVMPGESHTYRFVAEDAGTFWYHSHQVSSEQVKKGLFG